MNPTRILVVIGTRPEAVKMAPVVLALRAAPWACCQVLATGQHGPLLADTLAFFGITPEHDLALMQPGQALAPTTALLLAGIDNVLAQQQPALVLAQGDTSTVLAAALAAFYRRIPFGHVEAGLRTGSLAEPFPEEANRVIADRLATLHFAPTEAARRNLLNEGLADAGVHVVGNTVVDALQWAAARVDTTRWQPPAGRRLLLVTAHRRENLGPPLADICLAVRQLAGRPDVAVLWPVHPNPQVHATVHQALHGCANVTLAPPLSYPDMVAALHASSLVLTDSGGVQEEAPALGKPVLVLRRDTERPEGVAAGTARLVGTDAAHVTAEAAHLLDHPALLADMARVHFPYGRGGSAQALVAVLEARYR